MHGPLNGKETERFWSSICAVLTSSQSSPEVQWTSTHPPVKIVECVLVLTKGFPDDSTPVVPKHVTRKLWVDYV